MVLIFTYGSNLLFSQMIQRCPSAKKVANHAIKGFAFSMARYDDDYLGGVAGIIPKADDEVHGVIYNITMEDLKILDHYEHVHKGEYIRQKLDEMNFKGINAPLYAHVAVAQSGYPFAPRLSYAQKIWQGANEQGLPKSYIERVINPLFNMAHEHET